LVKLPPELKKRTLSQKQRKPARNQLGAHGESLALEYLVAHGYHLLSQNLTWNRFEVDIVVSTPDGQTLVCVEVKTRRSDRFGHASQALGYKKRFALRIAAQKIAHLLAWQGSIRCDLVTVTLRPPAIEHFIEIL